MNRRAFLFGAGAALIAAPAVVSAASLMPVRGIVMDVLPDPVGWVEAAWQPSDGRRWTPGDVVSINGDTYRVTEVGNGVVTAVGCVPPVAIPNNCGTHRLARL